MSRLAGLLVLVLGSAALADTAEPPPSPPKSEEPADTAAAAKASAFPLRVVKVLMDSEQALLFDNNRGRHVLVEVGATVGDYTVSGITDDEVTLVGTDIPVEVVLASPDVKPKVLARKPAANAAAAPADPYADVSPADPYADEPAAEPAVDKPIRAVTWGGPTAVAGGEGEKATTSPLAGAQPPKPSEDVAKRGTLSKTDEGSVLADAMVGATAKPAAGTLTKHEVQAALADFGALAASITASFVQTGIEIKKLAPGSVFEKAGLAAGDIVTAVDGKPLRTLDDAADLYARAGAMRGASVQVLRGGKPQTLRVTIQ